MLIDDSFFNAPLLYCTYQGSKPGHDGANVEFSS